MSGSIGVLKFNRETNEADFQIAVWAKDALIDAFRFQEWLTTQIQIEESSVGNPQFRPRSSLEILELVQSVFNEHMFEHLRRLE